jgi:hypothetical protein
MGSPSKLGRASTEREEPYEAEAVAVVGVAAELRIGRAGEARRLTNQSRE